MKKNLSLGVFGFIIMLVIMRFHGASLVTAVSPRAIIDLEFADTPQRVRDLLAHWDPAVVKMNIWIDFAFILSYVYFLFMTAELFALKWPIGTGCGRRVFFSHAQPLLRECLMWWKIY